MSKFIDFKAFISKKNKQNNKTQPFITDKNDFDEDENDKHQLKITDLNNSNPHQSNSNSETNTNKESYTKNNTNSNKINYFTTDSNNIFSNSSQNNHFNIKKNLSSQKKKETVTLPDSIIKEIRKNVYEEEYQKIYDKIKLDLSNDIITSIIKKKEKEISYKKKELISANNKKLKDYEITLKLLYKKDYDNNKKNVLDQINQKYTQKYNDIFIQQKNIIKNNLNEKYNSLFNNLIEANKNELINLNKKISKEKNRIKELDKIKYNYYQKEKYSKTKNMHINTMLNEYKNFQMDNRRIDIYPRNSNIKKSKSFCDNKIQNEVNTEKSVNIQQINNKIKNLKKNYSYLF